MDRTELVNQLIGSLARMYNMEAIAVLADFLQGELHVLQYLYDNKERETNPSILSAKTHVSRSRITAALTALRKKGYVTMELSEEDRRRMRVLLTENGEAYIKSKQEQVEHYFDVLVGGLGEENALHLIRLIELSIETMNKGMIE